jgi:hypothetical protein
VINPILLPQRTEFKELVAAIPEMQFMQPRGVMRTVIQSGTSYIKADYGSALAIAIGTTSVAESDLAPVYELLDHFLRLPLPLFVEDDTGGQGECAVCGKRGVLGRCVDCGLLMHFTCVTPTLPGRPQQCPRCKTSVEELPEEER